MIIDPEQMEALKGSLSTLLIELAPEGRTGLSGPNSEKIEALVRLVFDRDVSEAEFRQALDAYLNNPAD